MDPNSRIWSRPQMSSVLDQAAEANPTGGINLLTVSFDAGDRGISQLCILSHLMDKLFHDENIDHQDAVKPPCEVFDMIGGTGTGGLLAIFLVVFKMTAKEALDEFTRFTVEVFRDATRDPREQTAKLNRTIAGFLRERKVGKKLQLIGESEASCKLVVPIIYKHHSGSLCVLRNYGSRQELSTNLTVAEAMLATCTIVPMFTPTRVYKDFATFEYVSGEIYFRDPIRVIIAEAHRAFGVDAAVTCILSIGCGHTGSSSLSISEATIQIDDMQQDISGAFDIDSRHIDADYVPSGSKVARQIEYLERIVMDPEKTASEVATRMVGLGIYHRLSASSGLRSRSSSEWIEPKISAASAKAYLMESQTGKLVSDCVSTIKARDGFTTLELLARSGSSKILPPSLPPLAPSYVERKDQMDFLEVASFERDGTPKMGSKTVVVTGTEGSGKTQLIRDFLEKHGNRFISCFYVDGSSKYTTRRDIVQHVRAIGEGHSHDTFDESIAFLLEPVPGGERLLIFDNVGGPWLDFASSLPRWINGTVIITSRDQSCGQLSPNAHLQLGLMTLDESIELLVRGTGLKWPPSQSDKESAIILVEEIGCLPSALAKAIKSMYETGYSIEAYISRYRSTKEQAQRSLTAS